jgi:hypothetical protein
MNVHDYNSCRYEENEASITETERCCNVGKEIHIEHEMFYILRPYTRVWWDQLPVASLRHQSLTPPHIQIADSQRKHIVAKQRSQCYTKLPVDSAKRSNKYDARERLLSLKVQMT